MRAKIVKRPDDYRWSSLGVRVRSKREAVELLYPLALVRKDGRVTGQSGQSDSFVKPGLSLLIGGKQVDDNFSLYRELVYRSGAVPRKGKGVIPSEDVAAVVAYHGRLGISDSFRHKVKNISEGLAFGSYELFASLQTLWERKHIRPRSFMEQGKGDSS